MLIMLELNYESLMFDQPEGETCNGIPVGWLHPSYPHIVRGDGKNPPLDFHRIVDAFHKDENGNVTCCLSGVEADGVEVVDGNPNNFLITNLQPVNKDEMLKREYGKLPKASISRTFRGEEKDLEVEIFGVPAFLAEAALDKLEIVEPPTDLGLVYSEARLLWSWNQMTKKQLLKGLYKLSEVDRQRETKVSISNRTVADYVLKVLQLPYKEKK